MHAAGALVFFCVLNMSQHAGMPSEVAATAG